MLKPKRNSKVDLRPAFIDALNELAMRDDRVVLIIPDVGFRYAENFKGRLLNTGVTEAATIILAAALALDGWKPWVYSMRNFVLYRPYEMVRNAIVCHNANVKLVGVSGSQAYKFLGFSHGDRWDSEDTETAKTLGLRVRVPKNPKEVARIVRDEWAKESASFIRL